MPKLLQFVADSVIYLKGNRIEGAYLLKSGQVCIGADEKFVDTMAPCAKPQVINPGEFFGVQAFLAQRPQEKTATCLQPSEVIFISLEELEQIAGSDPELVFKLLRTFSLKMIGVHDYLKKLLTYENDKELPDPEDGLFNVAWYFYKNRYYQQAAGAMQRYLEQYPDGQHAQACQKYLQEVLEKRNSEFDASQNMLLKSNLRG